ncbi:MAG: hypothetical protein ABFR33_01330 [Verrucomicrobiota bacterium]
MEEVIELFNRFDIRYLLIGGQAVRLEGFPRFSMDWDFFIPASDVENISLINDVIGDELDIPLLPIGEHGENLIQTFPTKWGVLQFHMAVAGLPKFDEVELRAVVHPTEDGTRVKCVNMDDLLAAKEAVARGKDADDIKFLKAKKEAQQK